MADYLLSQLDLPGISTCELRHSCRAQRMRIELRPDRSLLLVVPAGTREDQWLAFLLSRKSWISRTLQQIPGTCPANVTQRYTLPSSLQLLCRNQQLQITHRPGQYNRYQQKSEALLLTTVSGSVVTARQVLRRWLVAEARKEFSRRLEQHVSDTGLDYNKLSIRGQKTRWGSCSARRNISLNYKLLFLPSEVVDHVLLHELVHTRHLNHSSSFWALLSLYDPASDENRSILRLAGRQLPEWLLDL